MGKYILTAPVLALAASAVPAHAQDNTWTGFYVGANGAIVDTDAGWEGQSIFQTVDGGEGGFTTGTQTVAINQNPSGSEFGGGGRVGFNWQAGGLVLGAEADAALFDFDGVATGAQPGTTYTVSSHASKLATVRARAGVAFGSAMLFATAGAAFSNLRHTLTATNVSEILVDGGEGGGAALANATASASPVALGGMTGGVSGSTIELVTANLSSTADSGTGWTIGGGGEVALSDNLSVALTVLHIDFGSETLGDSAPPSGVAATVDSTMLLGMAGINLRF